MRRASYDRLLSLCCGIILGSVIGIAAAFVRLLYLTKFSLGGWAG